MLHEEQQGCSTPPLQCAEHACGAVQMEVDFEAVTDSGQPVGNPVNEALAPLFAQMMQAVAGQTADSRLQQPTQVCHTVQMLQESLPACKRPVSVGRHASGDLVFTAWQVRMPCGLP